MFLNEMQSFLKDIQLLPFQEWHSEMSHNQILTKLQFQKIINAHYVVLQFDLGWIFLPNISYFASFGLSFFNQHVLKREMHY